MQLMISFNTFVFALLIVVIPTWKLKVFPIKSCNLTTHLFGCLVILSLNTVDINFALDQWFLVLFLQVCLKLYIFMMISCFCIVNKSTWMPWKIILASNLTFSCLIHTILYLNPFLRERLLTTLLIIFTSIRTISNCHKKFLEVVSWEKKMISCPIPSI